MYRIYFRQAIQILRQNMVMSIIAILGTALAIMMIMTIIVAEEAKNVSVSPEINRHRTYYIMREMTKDTINNSSWVSGFSFENYYNYFRDLETPEVTSAYMTSKRPLYIEGINIREDGLVKYTDANFFRIMALPFIAGRTFTEEEFNSGIRNAVISEGMARKLLKDGNPLESRIMIGKVPYNIIGVVKDISGVFRQARADVWVPYTSREKNSGQITFMMLVKGNKDYQALYNEIREREKRHNSEKAPLMISVVGPVNHRMYSMNLYPRTEEELVERVDMESRKKWLVIGLLLLVPAINLSGFSFSRIKKRMSEIGVRKAFGAKKYVILTQVVYENLITSFIGGILGLLGSYAVIIFMKDWLLDIPADNSLPISTLASPVVFLAVFIFCIIINLLSSGIPAWKASRVVITNSLNQNEQ